MYIPDMTERFPEGLDGIDLTDSFFPPTKYSRSYDFIPEEHYDNPEDELPFNI